MRRNPQKISVIRLKSNILPPPNFWSGYASGHSHCGYNQVVTKLLA